MYKKKKIEWRKWKEKKEENGKKKEGESGGRRI